MDREEIKCVSDYLGAIARHMDGIPEEVTAVFRGEPRAYETACRPGLFRLRLLEEEPFFEKNLFDEMSANHLTTGSTYLEKVIDAQHGGFPSRLLDVSYNCLMALYFAVTPYYTQPEDSLDGEDGKVFLFRIGKMYCPAGNNINDAYNAIVTRSQGWACENELFQKNHKLIDHIKKNPRIIAQQGAFILFPGDQASDFPTFQYDVLTIRAEEKKRIRKELRQYFGIHTGSVYPEEYNLVEEITQKSKRISPQPFTLENEVELVFANLEKLLDHYCTRLLAWEDKEGCVRTVMEAEEAVLEYRRGLAGLLERPLAAAGEERRMKERWARRYNALVQEFCQTAREEIPPDLELAEDALRIIYNTERKEGCGDGGGEVEAGAEGQADPGTDGRTGDTLP